jgi:hypothetical protein
VRSELLPGESIVKQGRVRLESGAEPLSGHLYLTTRRLVFESYWFEAHPGATTVDLEDIAQVGKPWARFLNLAPLVPNSVTIETQDGRRYRFVCAGRDGWSSAIQCARARSTLHGVSPSSLTRLGGASDLAPAP